MSLPSQYPIVHWTHCPVRSPPNIFFDKSNNNNNNNNNNSGNNNNSNNNSNNNNNNNYLTNNRWENLICFHSKRSYKEDVLGVGIEEVIKGRGNVIRSISIKKSMDFLSYTSFYHDQVRKGVVNQKLEYWIPLYINNEHAERAIEYMIDSLEQISRNSNEDEEEDDEEDDVYHSTRKKFNPMIALDIFPKLMETTLVNVLSNQLYASDIAIDCYCNFHRWLIYFVQKFPNLVGGFVNSTIEKFIESDKYRDKKIVRSLGEFLGLLTVSQFSWGEVKEAYLMENLDRNIFWILKDNPQLHHLSAGDSQILDILEKSFQSVKIGKQLVAFYIYFLSQISQYSLDELAENFDKHLGVSIEMRKNLQQYCKTISSINSWADFFDEIIVEYTPEILVKKFLKAKENSISKNYHKQKKKKCWYFLKGNCAKGDNCLHSHINR